MTKSGLQGNLLIVEDESALSEILIEMVAPICDEIYSASNGKEALEILKSKKVHAVISDINMPIMTGFQLLSTIRTEGNNIPFVTLTAYGDQENMRESIRLNANDFMTKPFDRKELIDILSKALQSGLRLEKIEGDREQTINSLNEDCRQALQKYKKQSACLRIENSKYFKNS